MCEGCTDHVGTVCREVVEYSIPMDVPGLAEFVNTFPSDTLEEIKEMNRAVKERFGFELDVRVTRMV